MSNFRKLLKAFRQGLLYSWDILKAFIIISAIILLVLLFATTVSLPLIDISETFGIGTSVVYLLDIAVTVFLLCAIISVRGNFSGNLWRRIGKIIAACFVAIFVVVFANMFCWGLGYCALDLFDVSLDIGWSIMVVLRTIVRHIASWIARASH